MGNIRYLIFYTPHSSHSFYGAAALDVEYIYFIWNVTATIELEYAHEMSISRWFKYLGLVSSSGCIAFEGIIWVDTGMED